MQNVHDMKTMYFRLKDIFPVCVVSILVGCAEVHVSSNTDDYAIDTSTENTNSDSGADGDTDTDNDAGNGWTQMWILIQTRILIQI